MLHGEEYEHKVLTTVDKFKGDFDRIVVSDPLMVGKNDFAIAASAVATQFPTLGKGEGVVLMGHGSPRDNNQSFGNTYKMLQETFDKMGLPVVVGTVEEVDTPNVDEVLEQIKARGYKTVHMFPLMIVAGETCIGADSHTCTYGALGAFSTGVGSTDMAAGMVTGKAWFKVPSAIKFNIVGEKAPYISGKDVILHIIGMIGVDGALYKSMEFVGAGIKNLTMDDRFTIANMAIEAGAKNGIFPVDEQTEAYMKEHSTKAYTKYEADADAVYDEEYTIDLSTLKPTVAFPHLPENTKTIDEVGDIKIDQVVIGSCTNGRISDMRIAADIIKGRHVAKGVRVIVIPGTQEVYLQMLEEGLTKTFIEAGAIVSTPTCGPCLGGHMGVMAAGERAVSTTNRNFVGRMGHVDSEVYLASPAVAAASAITGKISSPAELA